MNALELASMLNGREYRKEVTLEEATKAHKEGLVIVFGASDDLMEFRGAIDDETGCDNGGTAYLTKTGLLENECDSDCIYFKQIRDKSQTIDALWCEDASGFSWTYRTDIPHETFYIYEDGEPYCRGIVFYLSDVKESA